MKKRNILVSAGMALFAGVAFAGAQFSVPVEIDSVNGFALGDQYSARTAKNDVEQIGCGVRRSPANGFEFGFCQARDADDNIAFCSTVDPVLIDEMGAIGEFGFISFAWDVNTGLCTRIGWSKQSQYLPNFTVKGMN